VELDREDPAVHFLLGAASARLGDWERARGSFVESLRLDPSNIEVQQSLAEALLKLRRYEEAAQEYDDALARVPEEEKGRRTNLLIGLADAQRGKGDWAGSIVTLRRAVDIEDESKEASNHLGWLLATAPDAEWRNGEEAVQLTQRFADNPNASAAFLDTLAAAYAETQQWDKGIAILERAIARAKEEGQASLEAECQRRLEMYRRQEPFRDQPEPR
jgi:tetratricopeptide (TPR) repeat protein